LRERIYVNLRNFYKKKLWDNWGRVHGGAKGLNKKLRSQGLRGKKLLGDNIKKKDIVAFHILVIGPR